jgi:S-DNA-T family DNA segregation ATPase FtsK/SpoIIIE
VEYLGDELVQDGREFVPTAELAAALEVEPKAFAQQMGELGCRPTRYRMPTDDGGVRQVRGYLTAEIRTAVVRVGSGSEVGKS